MKYGILGGAFNPFHSQHAKMAEEVKKALKLDKIILVPTLNPPHKENSDTSFEHRTAMLEEWAKGRDFVMVDRIESELCLEHGYAYQVIPALMKKYPEDSSFVYIIGGDSMIKFHTWVHPEIISKEVPLAVVPREGFGYVNVWIKQAIDDYGARITLLDSLHLEEVSSSELWAKLQLGMDVSGEIPCEVKAYIERKGLYQDFSDMVARVKNSGITEKLFGHMSRTAVYAASHARAINVDVKKAFIAGLLHDIAKQREPIKPVCEYETQVASVIHQYDGAVVAKEEYAIFDEEMLDAIRYHTTGKPDMTYLGKLVYVADKLEDARCFEGIDEIRKAIDLDFDKGFLLLLQRSMEYLSGKGIEVDDLTAKCYEYYNNI